MPDSDDSRTAEQTQLGIARNLLIILENADFYWGLATEDPKYKGVTATARYSLTQAAYAILKENIDCLAEADNKTWTRLDVWGFVVQFVNLLRQYVDEDLPWETVWDRIRKSIKQWAPVPDFDHFRQEIRGKLERLSGEGSAALRPVPLSPQAVQYEASAGPICLRRVGKLYMPPRSRYFGCRHCHELTYTSAQGHDKRVDRLRRNPAALLALMDNLETLNASQMLLALKASRLADRRT